MYKKDKNNVCCFFQLLFHCAVEVKFDNFSVLWLNIAYFYLHGKENRFKCLCGQKTVSFKR